jgi:hypothetical protein
MATNTSSFAFNAGTDALWRTLITNIAATFTAGGLVQTSDTGQINLSTVIFPTTTNTFSGYQMFRFNDALQSTLPIFMRVAYYRGVTGSAIRLDVSFGTATDGAGVLSGQLSAVTNITMTGTPSTQTCYTSGDGSRFVTGWGVPFGSTSSAGVYIMIERLRDANGANTGDGFFYFLNQQSSATGGSQKTFHQTIPATGIIYGPSTVGAGGANPAWPWPGASLSAGGNLYMTSLSPFSNQLHNPTTGLMKYWATDITTGSEFTLTHYSTAMNFKAMGPLVATEAFSNGSVSMMTTVQGGQNYGFAIRWE